MLFYDFITTLPISSDWAIVQKRWSMGLHVWHAYKISLRISPEKPMDLHHSRDPGGATLFLRDSHKVFNERDLIGVKISQFQWLRRPQFRAWRCSQESTVTVVLWTFCRGEATVKWVGVKHLLTFNETRLCGRQAKQFIIMWEAAGRTVPVFLLIQTCNSFGRGMPLSGMHHRMTYRTASWWLSCNWESEWAITFLTFCFTSFL